MSVPEDGWIQLRLHHFPRTAHIHADSRHEAFLELVLALHHMLLRDGHAVSSWNEEPNWAELHFMRTAGTISLSTQQVHLTSASGPPPLSFGVVGAFQTVCLPFVRALRQLRESLSEDQWLELAQDTFPEEEWQNLLNTLAALPEGALE